MDDAGILEDEDIVYVLNSEDAGTVPFIKTLDARVTDVTRDGNCFFYSVHASLKEGLLLKGLCSLFGFPVECIENEKLFSEWFRRYLSESAEYEKSCNNLLDFICPTINFKDFDNLDEYMKGEYVTMMVDEKQDLMSGLDQGYQEILRSNIPCRNRSIIIEQMKRCIQTDKVYACEIDVNATKSILLDRHGILLDVKTRILARLIPYKNRIVLYREGIRRDGGDGENHFQWFSFVEEGVRKAYKYTKGGVTRRRKKRAIHSRRLQTRKS